MKLVERISQQNDGHAGAVSALADGQWHCQAHRQRRAGRRLSAAQARGPQPPVRDAGRLPAGKPRAGAGLAESHRPRSPRFWTTRDGCSPTPIKTQLIEEIKNELLGLGPLEPLLWDDEITDILVNGHSQVYIENGGKLHATEVKFQDDQHLMLIIDRIVSQVGRRVDEASPMVDARLPDGSRINAIIPPLALDGPSLSIRRFGRRRYTIDDLVAQGHASRPRWSSSCAPSSAPASTSWSAAAPARAKPPCSTACRRSSRPTSAWSRSKTRPNWSCSSRMSCGSRRGPPNVEGKGEVTPARAGARTALRMRPDRIIVGEVRGGEVFDMLQAMSTGHDGSICTIHANTPRDSLGRLEMMMLLSGVSIPQRAMRQQIASALNVIVHVSRLSDGSRKVMRISEIGGHGRRDDDDAGPLRVQSHRDRTRGGKVLGQFRKTGIRSAYTERIEAYGYRMDS